MAEKQRFFIYDRKEVGVLLLLVIMVAVFAFTFGVHLGKRVIPAGAVPASPDAAPVTTHTDAVPNRQELAEQSKNVGQAVDESLNQSLHDEVARTGIRLETPRQVELPEQTRAQTGGATTLNNRPSDPLTTIAAAQRTAPEGKFTLQIGSFATVEEARERVEALEALGINPFLRSVDVKGKGRWFRVYLGGYPTREAAEASGEKYRSQHIVDNYIVAQISDK